jgi:hypothetical protein
MWCVPAWDDLSSAANCAQFVDARPATRPWPTPTGRTSMRASLCLETAVAESARTPRIAP